jgi:hypothetical protein
MLRAQIEKCAGDSKYGREREKQGAGHPSILADTLREARLSICLDRKPLAFRLQNGTGHGTAVLLI